MRWGRFAALMVVGLALLASGVGHRDGPPSESSTGVVVTTRALPAGTLVRQSDVTTVSEQQSCASSALSPPVESVVGRRTTVPLSTGALVIPTMLEGPGSGSSGHDSGVDVVVRAVVDARLLASTIHVGDAAEVVSAGGADDRAAASLGVAVVLGVEPAGDTTASGRDEAVTLSVPHDVALRLAAAQATGRTIRLFATEGRGAS